MAEPAAQTAFAEEALTHLDTLYRGALRLTHDPDQAQDLVIIHPGRKLGAQLTLPAGGGNRPAPLEIKLVQDPVVTRVPASMPAAAMCN